MKKYIFAATLGLLAASLTGCDDFLNDNRYPESLQTASPEFWNNAANVQGQINYFYQTFTGYGNSSGSGEFYFPTLSDDQCCPSGNASITPWKNIKVPTSSGSWNSPYTEIRRANLIIEGVQNSKLAPSVANNFIGMARMMRGLQYYWLVRAYGDVPLIEKALDPTDDAALFGPRTAREQVMDYALADFDYAIENIAAKNGKQVFSQDLASAMKAEMCLFEAAFARYHKKDEARAQKYYAEVVKATEPLLAKYPISNSYQSTYNSFNKEALANKEIIFLKEYVKDIFMHCTVDYTSSSTPVSGITKDAFDAYLFTDGKPLALTSCDKSDVGKMDNNTYSIADLLAVRDGRLSQTIDPVVYYTGFAYQRPNSMPMTSLTGYGISKFNNPEMTYEYTTTIKNYTCAPLYWGAQIVLAYAEAKAELGTLTDADIAKSIAPLYTRANLPVPTVADMTAMNDPANNMNVSSLIWEIRRCRRCELILDKDTRYWDLVRWHCLNLLDNTKYPNIGLGANMTGATVAAPNVNGYYNAANGTIREFTDREYFFPIPSGQIALNDKLTQNPGWDK